jgi:hypothetical protein
MAFLDWAELTLFLLLVVFVARPVGRLLAGLADDRRPTPIRVRSRAANARSTPNRVPANSRPDNF